MKHIILFAIAFFCTVLSFGQESGGFDPVNPPEPNALYKLTFQAFPASGGSVPVSTKYKKGESVWVSASPAEGFHFKYWKKGDEIISTTSGFNYVTGDEHTTLIAHFEYNPGNPPEPTPEKLKHTLSLRANPSVAGSFNINSGQKHKEGDHIYLYAYNNEGFVFRNWALGDSILSTNASYSHQMGTEDQELIANFVYDPGNPQEPWNPGNQEYAVIGLTEKVIPGKTIIYPVYLLNQQIPVTQISFDIQFPHDVTVNTAGASLSSRRNGHTLSVEERGGNQFSVNVMGNELIQGSEGALVYIPVTVPDTWLNGEDHPVDIRNAFLDNYLSAPVRTGSLLSFIDEGRLNIYASFFPDIYMSRVMFRNMSSGEIDHYRWDFGDGTIETDLQPYHVYQSSGEYTVKLLVSNDFAADSTQMRVMIAPEDRWEWSGVVSLNRNERDPKNFMDATELFHFLSKGSITGNVRVEVGGGQTFDVPLTGELEGMLISIKDKLAAGNHKLIFTSSGEGGTPVINFTGMPRPSHFLLLMELGKYLQLENITISLYNMPVDLEALYSIRSQVVCSGDPTEEVNFKAISPALDFVMNLQNPPATISGQITQATDILPSMTLVNSSDQADSLTYQVEMQMSGSTLYHFEYRITVLPTIKGTLGDLLPNNEELQTPTVNFSWRNISNSEYDLYIWEADSVMPTVPYVTGLTGFRYTDNTYCEYGKYYKWKVIARNNCNTIESAIASFHIRPLPDLHVTSITHSDAYAGRQLNISWTVQNDGRGSTGNTAWSDCVWLVPDVFTGTTNECTLLKQVPNMSALLPGESYTNSIEIQLPERLSGNYYLLVTADMYNVEQIDWSPAGNQVPVPYEPALSGNPYPYLYGVTTSYYNKVEEENETLTISDNFFYQRLDIGLPPLPDLQVTSIIPPNNFYSGQEITVPAEITNKGEGNIVNRYWTDVLYISTTNVFDAETAIRLDSRSGSRELSTNEKYNIEFKATVPLQFYGEAYFFVVTDEYDQVFEHANAANNTSVSNAVNVILTPPADLSPVSVQVPSVISTGASYEISAVIRNIGAGYSNVDRWTDIVYLSRKNTGIDESAIEIYRSSYTSGNTLAPGGSYTLATTYIPGNLNEGEYYLYVKTDGHDAVFELDKDNNVFMSEEPVTVVKPDLTVEIDDLPELLESGKTYGFSWKLSNKGKGEIRDKKIIDNLTISRNQSGTGAFHIGNLEHNLWLKEGEEKIIRGNFTMPYTADLNGTCYLVVQTDYNNHIYESNENNNRSLPVERTYRFIPKPDLSVIDLSVASEIVPGELATVTYTLRNIGPVAITNMDYSLKVYISSNSSQPGDKAVLCEVEDQTGDPRNIASGGSVNIVQKVRVPVDIKGGNQYLHVLADQEKVLDEVNTDNNRASRSVFIAGNLPDLSISSFNVPEVVSSGEEIEVEWTVDNMGTMDCTDWSDAIWLSADNTLSYDDQRLHIVSISGVKAGESYTMKAHITFPDKWHGNRFVILKIDQNDRITEINRANNIRIKPITISLSPLPDLSVHAITLPGECISGQPFKIIYEVGNIGSHATRQDKWTDEFYLSEGTELNKSRDILLGKKMHVGIVEAGDSYIDSLEVNIPAYASGNYSLFVHTDAGDAVFESGNPSNNIKYEPVSVRRPLPCDLTVEEVIAPVRIVAGEEISISYLIRNSGTYPASGILKDAIYVSADAVWDVNDLLVGTTSGHFSAEPGAGVTRTATGTFTNVPAGDYYVIIRTNLTNSIIESSMTNNYGTAPSGTTVDFKEMLPDGSEQVGTSGYFKVNTSSSLKGETLALYLENEDENVHTGLYVSHNRVPTVSDYDFSASRLQTAIQEVLIPSMQEGTYYMLARNNSATVSSGSNQFSLTGSGGSGTPAQPMTLSSRILYFEITNVRTSEGGNGGSVTSDVSGAKFDSIMDFRLTNGDRYIPAEAVYFQDQTQTVVTFNLYEASAGQYDVIAELPGGSRTSLDGGYRVIPGVTVPLYTKIVIPSSVRIDTKVPFSVEYGNAGTTDVSVSELLLISANGHPLGLNTQELDSMRTEIRIPLHEAANGNKPSVLAPGTKGTRTVFVHVNNTSSISLRLYIIRKD